MKCEDKQGRAWPFRPVHITNDGDARGLTGTGILTNRHLQGIQSELCHEIGHPTTLVEFTETSECRRTDSPLLSFTFSRACRTFRRANTARDAQGEPIRDEREEPIGRLCALCDDCHARLLRGLEGADLYDREAARQVIATRIEESKCLRKLYGTQTSNLPKLQSFDNRLFITYDCPLLGYREAVFPVLFEDRILAVLLTGQVVIEGQEGLIEQMRQSLLDRFPGCLVKGGHSKTPPESIIVEIREEHERWLSENPGRRQSIETYNENCERIVRELRAAENLLQEEMDHQRAAYVRKYVSRELDEFSTPLQPAQQDDEVGDEKLQDLWARVQRSMTSIVDRFSLRYALVFGAKRIVRSQDERLTVVAKTSRCSEAFSDADLENAWVEAKEFPKNYMVCSREQDAEYLDRLHGCVPGETEDFQLIFMPVAGHPYSSIAFLVGYRDDHPSTAPENLPGRDLNLTLRSFDAVIVSSVAATLARGAEDIARKQLRYLGHEVGQLVTGIDWLRLTYLRNPQRLKALPQKKAADLCESLEGLTSQMSFTFDMASRVGSAAPFDANMTEFQSLTKVLCKWKDIYRLETAQKHLQLRVARVGRDDRRHPNIYADQFLFEQVVSNLVNNAAKYSHRGMKIDLDCILQNPSEEVSPYLLLVTDYGSAMPSGREVYLPFKRGEGAEGKGLGLGLYIARLIVEEVHGGRIEHTCDLVSKFNIPLLAPYLERSFEGKNAELLEELKAELERFQSAREYERIVAFSDEEGTLVPRYRPSDEALRNEILKPTFKVTIAATIPSREGEKR